MKFKIHFTVEGVDDFFIIEKDHLAEVRGVARDPVKFRTTVAEKAAGVIEKIAEALVEEHWED